jgi:hypothetical protein
VEEQMAKSKLEGKPAKEHVPSAEEQVHETQA